MTTALAPTIPPIAHRAAVDLAAVREQWGDLLAAIGRRPAVEWPPREARGFLDQLATDDRDPELDEVPVEATVGRTPLVLREHPAPLNLDALDAALDTERDLFDLADRIAEQVQRPIRTGRDAHGRFIQDQADAADPARWHYQAPNSPGSRAYGLHWAAVWIEGRVLDEDIIAPRPSTTVHVRLFATMPPRLLDDVAATAARARRNVERALGRDGRTTTLDDPCPWCAGPLTGRTQPGGEPLVTCSTGYACGAPVMLDDRGRRTWRGAELVGLFVALDAARRSG
ncbi:hypothetical protein [Streptomyces sioyaensis]|uniref:hypothetical protein n=1 Tax=Streptomyces sioyaensis TaxID=67364 RepID=UPI0036E49097